MTDTKVEVRLPVAEAYAHLLRLMVAGMANRLSFDIDSLDDLKIAVEEAYLMAIACKKSKPITVSFEYKEDALEVLFRDIVPGAATDDPVLRKQVDYGMFIIEAVVDDAEFMDGSGGRDLRLIKKLAPAAAKGADSDGSA